MRNLLVLLFILLGGSIASAQSGMHGDGHAQNHKWYNELKQPHTNYSCCNDKDCRPVKAEMREDGWYVWIDVYGQMKWVLVPPRNILDQRLNKEPFRNHVCASPMGYIYCFLAGSAGS